MAKGSGVNGAEGGVGAEGGEGAGVCWSPLNNTKLGRWVGRR